MRPLSDHSRSGVPTAPRKYLVVTMLAALTLQKSGNSTPRCSKLIEPSRQLVITTSRRSHVTSSYGCTPSVVHTRSIVSPLRAVVAASACVSPAICGPLAVVAVFDVVDFVLSDVLVLSLWFDVSCDVSCGRTADARERRPRRRLAGRPIGGRGEAVGLRRLGACLGVCLGARLGVCLGAER